MITYLPSIFYLRIIRFHAFIIHLDAKEDRRNASKLYNPIILEKMEVLSGHPPSWVEYVDKLIVGHDIPSNEVGSNSPTFGSNSDISDNLFCRWL